MFENRITVALYFLLAIILMLPLFGSGYYLALDMQFGPNSFSDFQFDDFYGYEPNPYGITLPFKMVFAALSSLITVEILEKVLLFLILFLCGFLMHISLPEKLGHSRYFGGFFYTLNPFVFIRFLVGHWTFLLSYALLPLAIKFFLDFIKTPNDNKLLAKIALITILVSISSHGLALLLMSYLIIFFWHLLISPLSKILVKQTLILAFLVIVMNLFWIVPTLLLFGDSYSPASSEAYLADFRAEGGNLPVEAAIFTLHGFWRGGFTYTKDVFEFWYLPFILIILLVAFGFIQMLKKDTVQGLSLISILIVAFLFAMGISLPIFENIIYFVFRDSQKFVGLIALVYSILASWGVYHVSKKTKYHHLLIIALLSLPIIYNFGFFGFLGQIEPTQYPNDWLEANAIIAADDTDSNILVFPLYLYSYYPWVNGTQQTLGNPAAQFFSKPVITATNIETEHISSDISNPQEEYLRYIFENRQNINNTAELLVHLNARYIVLFKYYENEYVHYLYLFHRQGGVPNIELVYESDDLYLFRNNLVKGPFIASTHNGTGNFTEILNLSDDYSYDVTYEKITPASYRVINSSYPYVTFADTQTYSLEFKGQPVSTWYQIATSFKFSGEGVLINKMFPIMVALFLLSWLMALTLLLQPSIKSLFAMTALFAIIFVLVLNGILKPAGIGALILLSFSAILGFKCLNLK